MITPFAGRYIIIIFITALVTIAQMTIINMPYGAVAFIYIFLSQILGPVLLTAILLIIFWFTGVKISSKTVFKTYLISWLAHIIIGFILIFTGQYEPYI